ncbi:hypothetical protein [Mesorhizobium sp. WSM3859]|uniref:hypothetical protein n=1 Tax=Mesorhizobium sp. WSM3859 TaxID=2029402 RepID=UPI000BB01B7F|nr:hypothetical protein [Mesorhizobium sp. WSM3859]PBC07871.1 hypothetical protein CK230_24515 [Mesorhizobium sp. WSM3859]
MGEKTNPPKKGEAARKERLAKALRANLQKRKAQTRSRRAGDADNQRARDADNQRARDADQRSEGLPAAGKMHKD